MLLHVAPLEHFFAALAASSVAHRAANTPRAATLT